MSTRLTPYQRIMRAYHRGVGIRLTRDEIHLLGQDGAIEVRAGLDDEGADYASDDYQPYPELKQVEPQPGVELEQWMKDLFEL